MSGYGFADIEKPVKYLREAGLHKNAKLVDLKYDATEKYEYFDIEIETTDGATFRERTFAPNPDKVFPRKKYEGGKEVGMETEAEAFARSINEVSTKLFYLGLAFVEEKELKASVAKAKDLKDFVEKVNKAITLSGNRDTTSLNFLTVWSNSDSKQRSNLVLPARTQWVEAYKEGFPVQIKLNKWQLENQMTEKYPFQGTSSDAPAGDQTISGEGVAADTDLPF